MPALRGGDRLLGARGDRQGASAGSWSPTRPQEAEAKLERACPRDDPDRPWLKARLAPLVGVARRARLAGGVLHRLAPLPRGVAEDGPTVLVFEDLHWADEALLAFLEHLADWSEGCRCSSSAPPARSCTSSTPPGGADSATRPDQPRPAHGRGDRPPDCLAARAGGAAGGDAAGAARARGRQPALRGGVRAPARRPRRARGSRGGARLGAGADRRPPGHALARAQEPAPGRRRDRQGVLGGRAGRDGRARAARGRAGVARARPQGARAPRPHELDGRESRSTASGTCWSGTSATSRSPAPHGPPATARRPPGSSARRASGRKTWPTCSPTTTCKPSSSRVLPGKPNDAEDLAANAIRYLALAGERALGLDTARAEARLAQALDLCPPADPERAELLGAGRRRPGRPGRPREARRRSKRRSRLPRQWGRQRARRGC